MATPNAEIIRRLHEYYQARENLKRLRLGLAEIAVELGGDQKDALKGGAPDFLDGFLVAQGIIPSYRDAE